MEIRKSFAIAMFVTSGANNVLAADWSGPFVGLTGGGGGGTQTQNGGFLQLPTVGGRRPPAAAPTTGAGSGSSTSVTTSSMTTTPVMTSTMMTTPVMTTGVMTSVIMTTNVSNIFAGDGRYQLHGGLVGGAVGYNWQRDKLVFGAVGDGSWADVSGSGTCGAGSAAPHACGGGIYALGTLRGRIGYDISPALVPFNALMIYGTGGLAVASVHAWDGLFRTSGSRVLPGWTAGGGFEARFGEHWSVNVEYLHVDLGTHGIYTAIGTNTERVRTTAELGRIGLSYHFNVLGPPPAVVAKY